MKIRLGSCAVIAAVLLLASTVAAETGPVQFSGELDTKFQLNDSRPQGIRRTQNLWNETNLFGRAGIGEIFSLNTALKYERHEFNNEANFFIDHDATFQSHGLTLRQLYGNLDLKPVALYAGKIHPKFGTAWGMTPGIFQTLTNLYEQDERLGFGIEFELPDIFGRSKVSAEAFKLDTTFLSEAAFSRPAMNNFDSGRTRRFRHWQGGNAATSNTDGIESYTLAWRGDDVPHVPGLRYHVSMTSEGVDLPGEQHAKGLSAGGAYEMKLAEDVSLKPFVEWTQVRNLFGIADRNDRWLTVAADLTVEKWSLQPAWVTQRVIAPDQRLQNRQSAISLVRDLSEVFEGLSAGVGYNHIRLNDRTSNTLGAMVRYQQSF